MSRHIMSLFKSLRILLMCLSFCIFILNCAYIEYVFKHKKYGVTLSEYLGNAFLSKKHIIIIIEIVFILGILSSPWVFSKFENTDIGSLFEKESYAEQYYVYLRKDDSNSKSYKLKADILKSNYGYFSWNDIGEEIFITQGNGYFIKKVYWPNGGYIQFLRDKEIPESTSQAQIFPAKETQCFDTEDNKYYITLTVEKCR